MSEAKISLKGEIAYKKSTKTVILDKKVFKVCEVKEERLGLLKRKILFIHFDGNTWKILHSNEDFTDIKYYKLK